jgi:hypothetical protein
MKRVGSLLSSVLLVAALVGCGSPSASVGAKADTWVDNVCARMTALDHEVAGGRADLDAQVSSGGDPIALLTSLDHFLGESSSFVSLAGDDIDRLGVPTLSGDSSSRLHRDVDTLFKRYATESADLEAKVKGALADTAKAPEQAGALLNKAGGMTDIDSEMRLILTDYDQLQSAFDGAASCQRWVDQLQTSVTTTTPTTTTTSTTTTSTTPPTTEPPATTVPPTAPPTSAPPTTPAPTTVPVTVDPYISVREQYLAAADEYNPKFDAVYNAFHDANDYILYKDMPTYCDQSATLEREWYDRMNAIPWPPDALDEAQAFLAESQAWVAILDQCAAAPGTRAGQESLLSALNAESDYYYTTVDALRLAIGLPSRGG